MKKIKVNTDSITDAKKRSDEELEAFSLALADMKSSVDELNAVWKGGNHDQFEESFAERYKQMQEVEKLLRGYLSGVATAVGKYESCESEVSGLASF